VVVVVVVLLVVSTRTDHLSGVYLRPNLLRENPSAGTVPSVGGLLSSLEFLLSTLPVWRMGKMGAPWGWYGVEECI